MWYWYLKKTENTWQVESDNMLKFDSWPFSDSSTLNINESTKIRSSTDMQMEKNE